MPELDNDADLEEMQYGQSGVDVDAGIIYLTGDLGQASLEHLATSLDLLVRESHDCILVRINSGGGVPGVGMAMYDLIQCCRVRVDTEVLGYAESAAVFPFLAGQERWAHQHSLVMVHGSNVRACNDARGMSDAVAVLRWYDECMAGLLGEHTSHSQRYWELQLADGRYHTMRGGDDLLAFGLATDLVPTREELRDEA
jgi:ATP-dependent protease ClpP protease subunit